MKNRRHLNATLAAAIVLNVLACLTNSAYAENPSATQTNVPQSVFIIPKDASEGRDPFYPNSIRPFGVVPGPKTPAAGIEALVFKGFSGTPGHRLAIINGPTIAEGETKDIPTPGGSVKVLCVEIKDSSVVIEVGGQRTELHLKGER